MEVIHIENLVKRYGDLLALDHFNLNIEEGEIYGLLGPNGSGKSTTINCILALLNYDKGSIRVFGKEMTPESYDLKRNIGVIMQNVAVFEELTVYDNIDYFCGLYIKDKKKRKELVEEAIAFVGLEDFKKFVPKKLSGGLLRRLNIACGIAHKPKLIILDEPTVAVDPQSRNHILEGIVKLNEQGSTIIYTSHYMEEIEKICTRITIMDKGHSLATGTTEELKRLAKSSEMITLTVKNMTAAVISELSKINHVTEVSQEANELSIGCSGGHNNIVHVLSCLQNHQIEFGSVHVKEPSLNDVFLEITGKELRDKE